MEWKVIETYQPSKYEQPFEREVAQFADLVNAVQFVNLVIPKERRENARVDYIELEQRH